MYTAVITGGGAGIGRAIALTVARFEYNIAAIDINTAGAAETARLCEAEGVAAIALEADMRDDAAVAGAIARVVDRFGGFDMLVCNAGVVAAARHDQLPMTEWQRILDVNLLGTVRSINAALPALRRSSHARIVIVGSSQAIMPNNPLTAAYTASKFALRGYAEAIRPAMAADNILFHFFCPGLTRTDFPVTAARFGDTAIPDMDLSAALSPEAVAERLSEGVRSRQFLISTNENVAAIMHADIDALLATSREIA